MVADITRIFRSSRKPCCASRASARPRSASSERSWNSSNSTAATPFSSGSSRISRVNTPSVTTSMRVLRRDLRAEAHAQADGVAGALAQRLRHAVGGGARRDPARLEHEDLAAWPRARSASTSGTRVVLPAPGGATSTATLRARSAAVSAGSASSMGSGESKSIRSSCPALAGHPRLSREPAWMAGTARP